MTDKSKLAILLEFGFHEIKKYIHSGFAERLGQDFDIVWFAMDKGSKEFDDYFSSTGFPIEYFDEKDFKKPPTKIEKVNRIARSNWIANKQLGGFHNHSKIKTKSFKTAILGNSLIKKITEKLALNQVRKEYVSSLMKSKIENHTIDLILVTGYNSCFSKSLVASGLDLKKKVHYLANSWKDLFINNFLPFNSFNTIFVWSDRMIRDFKFHMPYLKKANFVVSGNPTFDILKDSTPKEGKSFYSNKYKIPKNSKWLLYTMMPVGLVMDEIENIQFIAKNLLENHPKEEYFILVRKNPTHSMEDFENLSLPENLVLTEHFCSYNREKDMIIQSAEGEKEWIDLIQHCEMNLSVPSTVTLEFLVLNKPVINVEFNADNKIDKRVEQFFEAGFYKPLFEGNKVYRCVNVNQLIKTIDLISSDDSEKAKDLSERAGDTIRKALLK